MSSLPPRPSEQLERELWARTVLCALGLVSLEPLVPTGFNLAIAYITLVLLSLWSSRVSFTYFAAFVGTCLAIIGFFMAPGLEPGIFWIAATNRLIAIAAIWATAFLCILRQRQAAKECLLTFERARADKENEELRAAKADLAQKNRELSAAKDAVVYALAHAAESRDMETTQHLERVRAYAQILAEELRDEGAFSQTIDDEFLAQLYRASPLHDIGKVCIRDSVLHNQGRLEPEEYELMKRHTVIGADILEETQTHLSDADFLAMGALVARCHHERFDGRGYPDGLSGGVIPLAARIVALADVYDALVSHRPYRESHTPEEARRMIESESGRQFDPRVVGAFSRRFEDFAEVQRRHPNKFVHVFDSAPADCALSQA